MVKIQTTVQCANSRNEAKDGYSKVGSEASTTTTKKGNKCLANFVAIVMLVALIMCILYVYVYGRSLLMYARCGGSKDLNKPTQYVSLEPDLERLAEYKQWVKKSDETSCGASCLSWYPSFFPSKFFPTMENINQTPLESAKPGERMRYHQQCNDMPLSQRFDCLPGDEADQKSCESRGCCWKPLNEMPTREKPFPSPRLHRPTHGTPLNDLPLNVPYCYYPSNYDGYKFVNFTGVNHGAGGFLERETDSGYPHDVPLLRMDVYYETETRVRIKIYDPHQPRWETPLPVVPETKIGSTDPLYSIIVQEDSGSFAVVRKSSSVTLFDTRNAAPLIYADQFLQLSTKLPSEYVYGLGEHMEGLLLDTYWKRRVLWNLDQIPEPGKNTYGSHPFYLSMEPSGDAHGVFLLNSHAMDVILQPTPALTFRVIGGVIDLYVFLGPTPNDVISQYTEVIGRPFLPPYWSLGYHQCKFGYKSLNKTREVWQRTRNAGIPFDVQWNDIDYMENNKDFTYDHSNYRELPNFVQQLHEEGMHYVPIIDPGISASEPLHTYPPWDEGLALHVFVLNSSRLPFIGKVWNPVATTWPDFTSPKSTYYWGRQILRYHSWVQIDGAWIDMNEPSNFFSGTSDGCGKDNLNHPPYLPPVHGGLLYYHTICMSAKHYLGPHYSVHNLYGLTEAISTNRVLQIVRAKRPFIISRSTFAGQGFYSGHWTGDVWSDWFNLWQSIPGILNFNMFGIPMVGADICGFHGNVTTELCLRWMQLGSFYPFSRNHNSDDTYDQDPVAMGKEVVWASRRALEIRYLLLPYLYSLFFRAHMTGEPVARPLFFQYPKDPRTYSIDTQFMWGDGLMISPVLKENVTEVEAYVPEGMWYDWYSFSPIEGKGSYILLSAPKDIIPLMIHGGTVIPTQLPSNTTTQSRKNIMGVLVAPNHTGLASGELFLDDGDSLDTVKNKKYTQVNFAAKPGILTVSVKVNGYQEETPQLGYFYLLGIGENITHVQVDGKEVSFNFDSKNKFVFAHGFKRSLHTDFIIEWN